MLIIYLIIGLVLAFFALFFIIGASLDAPRYKGPISDHFDGKKFFNPNGKMSNEFGKVIKWLLNRDRSKWEKLKSNAFSEKPSERVYEGIQAYFINHSSFLIQVGGLNIITDPVFSKRVSPFSWSGPSRKHPPAIEIEDLPEIDIMILSHNHYDHLDIKSFKKIYQLNEAHVYCPLGVGQYLRKKGMKNITEMDWWDESSKGDLKVICTPAQHFSGRGLFDRDTTLWAGFILEIKNKTIYYVGDTGYDASIFSEVKNRFSDIDLTFIPIGAYKPIWFMNPIHINPKEALQIHNDIDSKMSIAMHFGTFPLADDGPKEAIEMFANHLEDYNISSSNFLIPDVGRVMEFN